MIRDSQQVRVTYSCWLVTEEEWFVSQQLGQHLQILLAKFLDFLRLVNPEALSFHLFGAL